MILLKGLYFYGIKLPVFTIGESRAKKLFQDNEHLERTNFLYFESKLVNDSRKCLIKCHSNHKPAKAFNTILKITKKTI